MHVKPNEGRKPKRRGSSSSSQCTKKCAIALYLFILGRELLQSGGQQRLASHNYLKCIAVTVKHLGVGSVDGFLQLFYLKFLKLCLIICRMISFQSIVHFVAGFKKRLAELHKRLIVL